MNKLVLLYGGITVFIIIVAGIIITLNLRHNQTGTTQPTPVQEASPTAFITSTPIPTGPVAKLTQGAEQSQADQNYGNLQQEVNQNYPWYKSMPLQTSNYFVYFDLTTKTFHAELYTNDPSTDTQLKSTIISQLQSLGVDLNKYKITWQINNP